MIALGAKNFCDPMKVYFSNLFLSKRCRPAGAPAIFIALLFLFSVIPHPAFAQIGITVGLGGGGVGDAVTLSDIMCNAFDNMGPFAPLFSALAFVAGAILIGTGLLALKDHADSPGNHPLHKGLARLGFGSALMTLPFIAQSLINTLFGPQINLLGIRGGGGFCVPGNGPVQIGPGIGLDVLVTNLIGNITQPFISLISIAAYIMGILFIVRGLLRGAKYGSDPKAATTSHIMAYLIIGALLIVAGETAGDVLGSLFGIGVSDAVDYQINTARVMGWNAVAALGNANFATVIAAALTFFQLIGILAFVRGLYIVKNAVEGAGQATMAQGFTHIIGGVLAINIYTILEVLDQTFGTNLLT
jgi:hypothetical protein